MNVETKQFKLINSMLAGYLSRSLKPLNLAEQQKIKGETYISGGYLEGSHNDDYTRTSIAAIKNNNVVLQSDKVKEPLKVRFAWKNTDQSNLFNKANLPASSSG